MFKNLQKGFTLLELLIVITILAILTLVVVLFINPVEMLKKARDVQRMSDMAVLRTAIVLYLQDRSTNALTGCAATTPVPVATSSQWVSVPSDAAVGVKFGSSQYGSTTATYYTKNDSTGWVRVNFASVASSSSPPVAKLPIDPVNQSGATADSNDADTYYYRYACLTNNTFELDATLESDAYTSDDIKAVKDGGNSDYRYEIGTNLNILPASAPAD